MQRASAIPHPYCRTYQREKYKDEAKAGRRMVSQKLTVQQSRLERGEGDQWAHLRRRAVAPPPPPAPRPVTPVHDQPTKRCTCFAIFQHFSARISFLHQTHQSHDRHYFSVLIFCFEYRDYSSPPKKLIVLILNFLIFLHRAVSSPRSAATARRLHQHTSPGGGLLIYAWNISRFLSQWCGKEFVPARRRSKNAQEC